MEIKHAAYLWVTLGQQGVCSLLHALQYPLSYHCVCQLWAGRKGHQGQAHRATQLMADVMAAQHPKCLADATRKSPSQLHMVPVYMQLWQQQQPTEVLCLEAGHGRGLPPKGTLVLRLSPHCIDWHDLHKMVGQHQAVPILQQAPIPSKHLQALMPMLKHLCC